MQNITVTASKKADKTYEVTPNQVITLDGFDMGNITFSSNGPHLVLSSDDNADVILLGFNTIINKDDTPTFKFPDGTEVNAQDFIQASAQNNNNLNDIEPAAGPTNTTPQSEDEGFNSPEVISDTYKTQDAISEVIDPISFTNNPLFREELLQREEETEATPAINSAPIAVNDAFTTPEDIALNITATQILANDTDVDGDTLTVTAVDTATAKGGSVTFDSLTGAIVYTP
ncbi:MAG: hypothetical protein ACI9TY_001745, partial [Alphaproteobacteria bacterium]